MYVFFLKNTRLKYNLHLFASRFGESLVLHGVFFWKLGDNCLFPE